MAAHALNSITATRDTIDADQGPCPGTTTPESRFGRSCVQADRSGPVTGRRRRPVESVCAFVSFGNVFSPVGVEGRAEESPAARDFLPGGAAPGPYQRRLSD